MHSWNLRDLHSRVSSNNSEEWFNVCHSSPTEFLRSCLEDSEGKVLYNVINLSSMIFLKSRRLHVTSGE